MRRRPAALAVQAAVLTALVGGTTAFVTLDKTVTLSVDGDDRKVRSFAKTVGDVLEREDIAIGPHDVVAPSAQTALRDDQKISVRYGRQLTLDVDGTQRKVWVTSDSVGAALAEVGLRAEGSVVSASRSKRIGRDGLALKVHTPKQVTLVADGKRRALTTTSRTVGGALTQAGVRLSTADRAFPKLSSPVKSGQTITVSRVSVRRTVQKQAVGYETVRRGSATMWDGTTRVKQPGSGGTRALTYRETVVDGKLAGRKLVRAEWLDGPVDRVILVGMKDRPAPERRSTPPASRSSQRSSTAGSSGASANSAGSASSASSGLNWSALAQCESGGNPRAVSPAGYYGLYQFSVSTWGSVGGSGNPADASPAEQTRRAQMLYDRSGRGQWPVCGSRL